MIKDKKKTIGNFTVYQSEVIGQGSFGKTCKAYKNKNKEELFACKMISKQQISNELKDQSQYFIKRVQQQYKALQALNHQNIVKLQNIWQTSNNIYLFCEYCDSNLQNYIEKHKFEMNYDEIYKFSTQIIAGCDFFTRQGFVHRDIKPSNILVKNDTIKIADFGLALDLKGITWTRTSTFVGTPIYMAPQILKQSATMKQILKCDIWSVGVTLFELSMGYLPFGMEKKQQSQYKIYEIITKNNLETKIQNATINQIIKRMLVIQPEKRIQFDEAYKILAKNIKQ